MVGAAVSCTYAGRAYPSLAIAALAYASDVVPYPTGMLGRRLMQSEYVREAAARLEGYAHDELALAGEEEAPTEGGLLADVRVWRRLCRAAIEVWVVACRVGATPGAARVLAVAEELESCERS